MSQGPERRSRQETRWATLALASLALSAMGGSTDSAPSEVGIRLADLTIASLLGQTIDGVLSQGVVWVFLGVVALAGIPWLVAGMALVASHRRRLRY